LNSCSWRLSARNLSPEASIRRLAVGIDNSPRQRTSNPFTDRTIYGQDDSIGESFFHKSTKLV